MEEWSQEAFVKGRVLGQAHHLNVMRVLKRGCSPLHLQELPVQLQVTVAYLPLYKECVATSGVVLSQWLRGQLVEAALRLNPGGLQPPEEIFLKFSKYELLSILGSRLPGFLLQHWGGLKMSVLMTPVFQIWLLLPNGQKSQFRTTLTTGRQQYSCHIGYHLLSKAHGHCQALTFILYKMRS